MPAPTNRESDKFMLRLPDGMRDRIAEEAKANGRSMNSEIIHRLQTTLEMDAYAPSVNAQPDPSISGEIDEHRREMRMLREELRRLDERLARADRLLTKESSAS